MVSRILYLNLPMYRAAIALIAVAAVAVLYLRASSAPSPQRVDPAVGETDVRGRTPHLTVSTVAIRDGQAEGRRRGKGGLAALRRRQELAVSVGDVVEPGHVLALLDDAEWRVRVAALGPSSPRPTRAQFADAQLARAVALDDTIASFELEARSATLVCAAPRSRR
jgi:hypothetical protein